MSTIIQQPTPDNSRGKNEQHETPAVKAEQIVTISGANVDIALERNFAILSAAIQEVVDSERMEAVQQLRDRHDEPVVALRLAELMMTSADHKVRELAEYALVGTNNKEASELLNAEYMLRKTNEGGGKFGTGPENADQLVTGLKEMREHPLVASRLIETIKSGSSGAYYAASVIQGTPDRRTHEALKEALTSALDLGFKACWDRKDLWQVPRALKYSEDPDTQALIIRTFKEGDEAFGTNNLRYQAACAMGAINTEEVRSLVIESVMSTRQDWQVRRGISEAIKELKAEEVNEKLLPLINGSASKTAWIVAGEQSSGMLGQLSRWVKLISSQQEKIHDIRVQIGLALLEQQPELAAKVLNEALKGKRDSFTHRCQFFAANDALRALSTLETTV